MATVAALKVRHLRAGRRSGRRAPRTSVLDTEELTPAAPLQFRGCCEYMPTNNATTTAT
jgi:hypothetical protein